MRFVWENISKGEKAIQQKIRCVCVVIVIVIIKTSIALLHWHHPGFYFFSSLLNYFFSSLFLLRGGGVGGGVKELLGFFINHVFIGVFQFDSSTPKHALKLKKKV